jgi:cytochrome c oxidase cbb3-type subunit 3
MSLGWSLWVMFLVVLNMGITFFLFIWGQRVEIPVQPDGTSGHVWAHGVLREGVRKLPRWWVFLSASMFAWGLAYLALYPGFGNSKGLLGWTSHGQLADDIAAMNSRIGEYKQFYLSLPISKLSTNPSAVRIGERMFVDNCAGCHGRTAQGNVLLGAPDLTDTDWLYGGDEEAIRASILEGRHGTMPPLGPALGEGGTDKLAHYVLSLSGAPHDKAAAAAGQVQFPVCAACHGADGKGNKALGAPDLTDSIWLYGGDLATIRHTIDHGRGGRMPAWKSRLDDAEVHVIMAWLHAQSKGRG